jgi:D-3-phosphoglycerate dehydrogenase / 2-oxoglutarate reductase
MGFGKVGSEVARRAKGLGMDIIAHDPYAPLDRARAIGVDLVSFDEAISTADFISLHMPLTPSTTKLFDDEFFAKMKTGVRIVNVARGGVVDEDALLRALDNGTVAQVIPFGMAILTDAGNCIFLQQNCQLASGNIYSLCTMCW